MIFSRLSVVVCVVAFLAGVFLGYRIGHPAAPPVAAAVAHVETQQAIATRLPSETAFIRRDRALTKIIAHFDTVRDTLRITDTLWVRQFVNACDDFKSACVAYRDTARVLLRADSDVVAKYRAELATQPKPPSRLSQVLKYSASFGVGYVAGRAGLVVHLPF